MPSTLVLSMHATRWGKISGQIVPASTARHYDVKPAPAGSETRFIKRWRSPWLTALIAGSKYVVTRDTAVWRFARTIGDTCVTIGRVLTKRGTPHAGSPNFILRH